MVPIPRACIGNFSTRSQHGGLLTPFQLFSRHFMREFSLPGPWTVGSQGVVGRVGVPLRATWLVGSRGRRSARRRGKEGWCAGAGIEPEAVKKRGG
jgi:hypothetical protein